MSNNLFNSPEDYEVDASEIFRSDVGNLAHVKGVDEALSEYGYSADDRIERREICKMYTTVKTDMENEIHRLAHSNQYEEAKLLRKRLTGLRAEFDNLQTSTVRDQHTIQSAAFIKAADELRSKVKTEADKKETKILQECRDLQDDNDMSHAIQIENLELKISRMDRPRVKYSKRAIELVKAEHELIRLSQYDDARKVRLMLEKLLPVEERKFYQKFDSHIADLRISLQKRQSNDNIKLEEKIKGLKWNDLRRREKIINVGEQRIKNHEHDMNHAHLAESKLRPEMSIKPSALWQKRQGYIRTSAANRGNQLLQMVRTGDEAMVPGAKEAEAAQFVFAASLTDKHDFHDHNNLSGTYTL
jgi:hypothetical protein